MKVKTTLFPEFISVTTPKSENPLYDIVINENATNENYCIALVHKIFELPHSKFAAFIDFQAELMKDELKWINKLEKLITINEDLFLENKIIGRYNKMFLYIDKKRDELQSSRVKKSTIKTPKRFINADAEDRHFSFTEVKYSIENIPNFNEKIIFITEEIFEYKQADIISVNNKLQPFDEQCTQLIEKLQTIRKMKSDFDKEKELENSTTESNPVPKTKIQINGPINILTNAFKQMMVNVKPNGTAYISYKIKDVAIFISDNFIDDKGQPISQATIQTYLSPNRTDKDPNSDMKVRF